jgi:hypothetical protein
MNMVPRKIEGAGKAGRQPHPQPRVRSLIEAHERSHSRFSQISPAFPAQWFDGLLRALPGERILVCHRRRRDTSRKLGTSNGCQDHTTWPYVLAFSSGAIR